MFSSSRNVRTIEKRYNHLSHDLLIKVKIFIVSLNYSENMCK